MITRIRRALAGRTPRQVSALLVFNLLNILSRYRPAAIRARRRDREFDRRYGVQTSGIRELGSLEIPTELARHAVRYQPSDPNEFDHMLQRVGRNIEAFTFVDYGSGKGRILLVAALHPFRRVMGIEFSSELHGIAMRNIAAFRTTARACPDITSLHVDARTFVPPDGPLLCYFYNPFDAAIMEPVVRNLERSFARDPRPILVLYKDPEHRRVFETSGHWDHVLEGPGWLVLEHKPIG